MTVRRGTHAKRWLALLASGAGLLALLAGAHLVSPALPGAPGEVFRQNQARDLDASALFYTEVTDVREFIDTEHGRYGLDLRPELKVQRTEK